MAALTCFLLDRRLLSELGAITADSEDVAREGQMHIREDVRCR
jgi:hypothetical protein